MEKIIHETLIGSKILSLTRDHENLTIEFEGYGSFACNEEGALQLALELSKANCTRAFIKESTRALITIVDVGLRLAGYPRNPHQNLKLEMRIAQAFPQDHSSIVYRLRTGRDAKSWEVHHEVAKYVVEVLGMEGNFYKAEHEAYWFNLKNHVLYDINSLDFNLELADKFDINPEDPIMAWVVTLVRYHALRVGQEEKVRMLSFFNKVKGKLYISNSRNTVYRLDGMVIDSIPNGEDGVIFMWRREWIPWTSKSGQDDLFDDCILRYLSVPDNNDGTCFCTSEARALVRAWVLYGFFAERTRPLLGLIGEKGSAKTTVLRLIGILLLGQNFEVTGVERNKQDGLIAYLTNLPYGVIDNADEDIPWLPDTLARTATSQAIPRRKLYTTNELALYPTRINLAITTRNPHWARDDVVDRTIPIRTVRPITFVPEEEIYEPVIANREFLWGEILQSINEALVKYNQHGHLRTLTRISEFEAFARSACNISEEIFKKMVGLQYGLEAQREEEILTLLPSWFESRTPDQSVLDGDHHLEVRTTQLYEKLKKYASDEHLSFNVKNASSLGRKLKELISNFRNIGIDISHREDGKGSIWIFKAV